MFRFTIRDLLWLMVVVGLGCGWYVDRWRQDARLDILTKVAGLEASNLFPQTLDGRIAAFCNEIAILRFQVDSLTRELQTRGHLVEVDGCNVFVDRQNGPLGILSTQQLKASAKPGARSVKDDAAIIEALADENAAQKEQIEVQQKLIETLKAKRREIRDKVDPA